MTSPLDSSKILNLRNCRKAQSCRGFRYLNRQQRFVAFVARGDSVQQAARRAGFSASYSKKSHRLLQCPAVANELELIREKGRELAAYGFAEAMGEAEDAAAFAKLHKNPMANVKACELRAKLSGLLIERVETVMVDLRGALDGARDRVLRVIDGTTSVSTVGSADWTPRIAGGESDRPVNNAAPEL